MIGCFGIVLALIAIGVVATVIALKRGIDPNDAEAAELERRVVRALLHHYTFGLVRRQSH